MKRRWLSLYVENDIGVLAKIAGMFSGKSYNMESLTVGPTEDETISCMTIGISSDDATYEQIKKQLNRCVEVIKVQDITQSKVFRHEIMFIKILTDDSSRKRAARQLAEKGGACMMEESSEGLLIRSVQREEENTALASAFQTAGLEIQVIRGGSVAIERK